MPFRDGTGPMGNGPASGRGRGGCFGGRRGLGRGLGAGRGGRFGWQQGYSTAADERTALDDEQGFLEARLASVKRRLAALGGKKETE